MSEKITVDKEKLESLLNHLSYYCECEHCPISDKCSNEYDILTCADSFIHELQKEE